MIFDSTGSVQGGTGWYLVILTWYCLVLSGAGLLYGFYASIYLKKVKIWWDVTIAGWMDGRTNEQTREERATQPIDHGRLR